MRVNFISKVHTAQGIGNALPTQRGSRILWPCSALAHKAIVSTAEARRLHIAPLMLYEPKPRTLGADVLAMLGQGAVDYVVLCSASVAHSFAMQTQGILAPQRPQIICIGATTREAAAKAGLRTYRLGSLPARTQ